MKKNLMLTTGIVLVTVVNSIQIINTALATVTGWYKRSLFIHFCVGSNIRKSKSTPATSGSVGTNMFMGNPLKNSLMGTDKGTKNTIKNKSLSMAFKAIHTIPRT